MVRTPNNGTCFVEHRTMSEEGFGIENQQSILAPEKSLLSL
jgi:hypothetical protein